MCIRADAINVRTRSNLFIQRESKKVTRTRVFLFYDFPLCVRAIFQIPAELVDADIDLVKYPQQTEAH